MAPASGEEHLARVRRICAPLPGTTEKLSHGEPTFFVNKRVYAMFANNHHRDGRIAVWLPTAPGTQTALLHTWPQKFFYPPYVGVSGWIGIDLDQVDDDELAEYLTAAWRLIGSRSKSRPKKPPLTA
jgi:hypothetical protein